MSTPSNDATQQQPDADSLEQKVKEVISKSTYDEETGKITLPDDIKDTVDTDTLYAVGLEHRRRNTQSGYTIGQQKNKSLEAENLKLNELLSGSVKAEIPKEDQDRLDSLKYEDPDQWRKEMDSIEKKAIVESRAKITELTSEVKGAAEQSFELDRRQQVLNDFNESAEVQITEELIANEVPPRITKELAEGNITFEEFLVKVEKYVTTGKTVKNGNIIDQPDMGNLGGGKTPYDMKPEKGLAEKYEKDTIY